MESGDYKQRAIYRQWAREYIDNRISEARAAIESDLNSEQGLSREEAVSLYFMSQPPIPHGSRQVTEQIFRWDLTATQFIAIQKKLALPLYLNWDEQGRIYPFGIYSIYRSRGDFPC